MRRRWCSAYWLLPLEGEQESKCDTDAIRRCRWLVTRDASTRGLVGATARIRQLRGEEIAAAGTSPYCREKGPGAGQCALDEASRMGEVGRPHQVGIGSGEHDKLRLARVARDVGAVREYFHSSIGIAAQRRRAQLGEAPGFWASRTARQLPQTKP